MPMVLVVINFTTQINWYIKSTYNKYNYQLLINNWLEKTIFIDMVPAGVVTFKGRKTRYRQC